MAGETVKSEAVCLSIRPWSRTSHVVSWLTPHGRVSTVVKGAVRPKSFFLGQYDLNYTCEIVYYARAKGELHALRECVPLDRRDALRDDFRALALAGYFRSLVSDLAPSGPDCRAWYGLLVESLDFLEGRSEGSRGLARLLRFELSILELAGLRPDFSGYDRTAEWSAFSIENGAFDASGRHPVRVSKPVAEGLARGIPDDVEMKILLDMSRVISVFYTFHLDCAPETRRAVLGMICNRKEKDQDG